MDKRDFNRIKTPRFFVEYRIRGSNAIDKVEVLNISAGGICFIRKSILNVNNILQIKFPFKTQKVVMTGLVARIDGQEVAAHFINNDEEIERFVKVFNNEYDEIKNLGLEVDMKISKTQKDMENLNEETDDLKGEIDNMLDIE